MADTDLGTVTPPTLPQPGIPLQSNPNIIVRGASYPTALPQQRVDANGNPIVMNVGFRTVSDTPPTPPTVSPAPTPDTRVSLSDPGPGWSGLGQFITPTTYAPPGQPPTVGSYWSNNQQQQLRPIATNLAQTASDPRGVIPTIIQAANAYGIDPNTAIAVAQTEGLTSFLGDDGTSGGAFQLHVGGGMGDDFRRDIGGDPLNPADERRGIWYAMKRASQEGWGAFHGAKNNGIGEWQGIRNNQRYVSAQSTPGLAYREPSQWGREPQEGWGTLPQHPLDFDAFVVKARKMQPYLSGDSALTQAYMVRAYDAYLQAFQNNQLVAMKYRSAEWQQHMQEMSDQLSLENKDIGDAMASNTGSPGEQMNAVRDLAIKYNDRPLQIAADHGPDAVTALMQARDHFGSDAAKTTGALENAKLKQQQDTEIENAAQADLAQWKAQNPNATPQEIAGKLFDFRAARRNQLLGKTGGKAQDPGKAADQAALDAAVEQDVKDKTAEYKAAHGGQDPSPGQQAQWRQDARRARESKPTAARAGDPLKGAELDAATRAAKADLAAWLKTPEGANATQDQQDQKYDDFLTKRLRGFSASGTAKLKTGSYTFRDSQGKEHGPMMGSYDPETGQLMVGGKAVDADPATIRPVSTTAAPAVGSEAVEAAKKDYPNKPEVPPPGANISQAAWQQAINAAQEGRIPVGLSGRSGSFVDQVVQAVPVAVAALGQKASDQAQQGIRFQAEMRRRLDIEQAFTSGWAGKQMVSLNTVADHIGLFRRYAAALRTNNVTAINALNQEIATMTGSPEVPGFEIAKTMTGDEVVRLLTTSGGTITDREELAKRMAASNSPKQFDDVADAMTNYVLGRYEPLRQAYSQGEKEYESRFDTKMITPKAKDLIKQGERPIAGEVSPFGALPDWGQRMGKDPNTGLPVIMGKDGKLYDPDHTPRTDLEP